METRSAMPSQTSPFFPIAAVLDLRFTTVDIAASLPAFGVVLDCMPRNAVRPLTPSAPRVRGVAIFTLAITYPGKGLRGKGSGGEGPERVQRTTSPRVKGG